MAGFFSYIDNAVDTVLTEVIKITQTNLANSISNLIVASISLYIVVYGYMIWAGKVQSPIKSIIWKLVSFAIILSFVKNDSNYLTLAGQAIEELATIGSDGSVGVGFLDDQFERMSMLSDVMGEEAKWGSGWFVTGLVLGAYVILAIPIFSILLIAKFTMFFLLGIAPLFIFCLMWGWLKDSFANYLSALLSNALIVIVARTLQKSLFDFFEKLTYLTDMNVYMLAFMFLMLAIFSVKLLAYLLFVVSKLSSVTVDKFPSSVKDNELQKRMAEKRAGQQQAQRDQVQQQILQQLQQLNNRS